jgi:dephospho-CoA kinase
MKIGITGGMGSGKSFVCSIIENLGYPMFNSDKEAKWLMENNASLIAEIKKIVGNNAYTNNKINKEEIRKYIFDSAEKRKKLNEIVHPAVTQHFENWAQQFTSNTLIFNESALLIETGSFKRFDKIILITAPEELKIKRLTQRENITKEEIILRMKSQLSDEEKKNYADHLIENNEKELLLPQIIRVLDQLNKDCSIL